jgi:general secretion pathway protein A
MYQAHFGLKKALFDSGIAQDAAVFLAPKHAEIATHCKLALATSDAALVLTGPAGVGKTTLMSAILRTTSTKLALGWITVAPANAAELLELLLVELGFNAHRVGRVERVQMWRQFLNEMNATSSRVYVIAERADELSPEVLRALDSLTSADPNGSLGANLVLLGQPALLDVLKLPMLESLRQRIRLRQRLEPLTADELRAYLDHHAKLAGTQVDKLFTRNAIAALHELSGGIPRVANNLCETALTLAATRKERLVAAEVLRHVATSMFGIEPTPMAQAGAGTSAGNERAATRVQADERPSPAPAHTPASAEKPVAAPISTPTEDNARAAVAERAAAREPDVPREPFAAASPARPASSPIARTTTEPPAPRASAEPPARLNAEPPPRPSPEPPARPSSEPPAAASTPVAPAKPAAASAARAAMPPPASASAPPPPPPPPSAAATATPPRASAPARVVAAGPPDPDLDAFADTLTDSPDVPMLDFPVLTDAVDSPARARTRPDTAYVKPPVAQTPAAAPKPASPLPRVVAPASAPPASPASRATRPAQPTQAAPVAAAAKPTPPARPTPPPPAAAEEEDALRQTQTMRGLMAAKSIDDISDSMAETLFGDADLDMLSAALAASGFSDDDEPASAPSPAAATPAPAPAPATAPARAPAATAKPAPAPKQATAEDDPFDFLGLSHDAPLELIDDPEPAPEQRKEGTRGR